MKRGGKIDYRRKTLTLGKKKMSFHEAEDYLCEFFPNILLFFAAKKTALDGKIIVHIDWQGVFMSPIVQNILHEVQN